MAKKRINRNRRLTPEEVAKYNLAREQIAQELPELIQRHMERTEAKEVTEDKEKDANEQQG
jgi:hypothetical protein